MEKRTQEIVYSMYDGKRHSFIIKNSLCGKEMTMSWYCAYVEVDSSHFSDDEIDKIEVHGGVTFSGSSKHINCIKNMPDMFLLGWDYNHCNDIGDGLFSNKWINDNDGVRKIRDEIEEFKENYL